MSNFAVHHTAQSAASVSLWQVAEEVFLLSRTVRTFGTEASEKKRYQSRLGILRHISIRQAGAYLLYLTSNSFLFNLTKVLHRPPSVLSNA